MLRRFSALLIAAMALAGCDQIPFAAANQQGGAYLVLEIDTAALQRQELDSVSDQMVAALRGASPAVRFNGRGVVEGAARIRLVDVADSERARAALRQIATDPSTGADRLTFTVDDEGLIEARLTPAFLLQLSSQAAGQSIEVIRRRVDPTGMGGVEITRRDGQRLFVRAPRIDDPDELRRSVGIVGLLTFNLVREVSPEDAAAGLIPPGTMVVQPYPGIGDRVEVVERRPRLTGARLTRASPVTDSFTGEFALSFELDSEGASIFCRITRQFTGQRFAVLLDNQVLTAPTINEPICGGSGQISGNFSAQSANDLAIVLRAGALPAPLIVIESGVIPPS